MEDSKEYFSSRLGFILSMMGVAIGAGNIWRFSRVVAQNGGGTFLIPWLVFLFLWSIPLIWTEIALGKFTGKGPIVAIAKTSGPSFGWMGAFIALVTTGILFYYSVVVGWGFRYFFYSVSGKLTEGHAQHEAIWHQYTHSLQPFFTHAAAIAVGCLVIYKGIIKGVERTNKILIPILLLIILIIAFRAVTLPGAMKGVAYLFTPDLKGLLDHRIWIEALTQNAWDTGAGWGLLLVYSGYVHRRESVTVNGIITAVSNNLVSLIMGITIFATAFSIESNYGIQSLINGEGSTNTGLTFIFLPKLFQELPGTSQVHAAFSSIFFLAFSFAALSSMISMIQLTSQVLSELGLARNTAILVTGAVSLCLGAPSALSMAFFDNQDWVWSLGLIVNGIFIAFAATKYGLKRFRNEAVNLSPKDFKVGKIYGFVVSFLIPAQGIFLILWYFYQSVKTLSSSWWNPFATQSIATLLLQWGFFLACFFILNKWLVRKSLASKNTRNSTIVD